MTEVQVKLVAVRGASAPPAGTAHADDRRDFDDVFPLGVWIGIACHLGWPDRAFFAAACRGAAVAVGWAYLRTPEVRRRGRFGKDGHGCDRDWECFVSSLARLRSRWRQVLGILPIPVMYTAAHWGGEPVLRGLVQFYGETHDDRSREKVVFERTVAEGWARGARVAWQVFGLVPGHWLDCDKDRVLSLALVTGDADLCRWLIATLDIKEGRRLVDNCTCCLRTGKYCVARSRLLDDAIAGGNLGLCAWIAAAFVPDYETLCEEGREPLKNAVIKNGTIPVCNWVLKHFEVWDLPGHHDGFAAARMAARMGLESLCIVLVDASAGAVSEEGDDLHKIAAEGVRSEARMARNTPFAERLAKRYHLPPPVWG